MQHDLQELLGAGGLLERELPGFRARDGQLRLAREIDRAIQEGGRLLAEAATGSGKGVGYLVPAIRAAVGPGGGLRVVVATANIALQEQLIGKDLPSLAAVLPWGFRYAIAKGRANYCCLACVDDVGPELSLSGSREERAEWARVQAWLDVTRTGDLSELTWELQPEMRRRLTVSSEECTGKSCDRYQDCYANQQYRALADADVVVTNYHLLMAHLAVLRASDGEAGVLPGFDVLVGDEIDRLADVARDFLGFRVTPGGIRWVGRLLGGAKGGKRSFDPIDPALKRRLGDEADRFGHYLRATRRSPDYSVRLRDPLPEDGWWPVVEVLRETARRYLEAASRLPLPQGRKVEVLKLGVRADVLADAVEEAMLVRRDDQRVYFIEEDERQRVALVAKPVSVADDLRAMVWGGAPPAPVDPGERRRAGVPFDDIGGWIDQRPAVGSEPSDASRSGTGEQPGAHAIRAVVGVSATLRTSSGFGYAKRELGAEVARELTIASPFDHHERAVLYFPPDMPEPRGRPYEEAVARCFSDLIRVADGRGVLGLFTSYRALGPSHELALREHGGRVRVMRQGEAPRTQLVRDFRADVSSVLLGTESFWTGIDVPGDACAIVMIDKLPFAPPDDPLLDAQQERNPRGWFRDHAIPRAVVRFRQGAGRLLRTTTDRGVIAVCDPRVMGKGYGRAFLTALPEMRIVRSLDAAAAFLTTQGPSMATGPSEEPGAGQHPAAARETASGRDGRGGPDRGGVLSGSEGSRDPSDPDGGRSAARGAEDVVAAGLRATARGGVRRRRSGSR